MRDLGYYRRRVIGAILVAGGFFLLERIGVTF